MQTTGPTFPHLFQCLSSCFLHAPAQPCRGSSPAQQQPVPEGTMHHEQAVKPGGSLLATQVDSHAASNTGVNRSATIKATWT
eukprot:126355-Chlamydomonas_euryale.AAC.8